MKEDTVKNYLLFQSLFYWIYLSKNPFSFRKRKGVSSPKEKNIFQTVRHYMEKFDVLRFNPCFTGFTFQTGQRIDRRLVRLSGIGRIYVEGLNIIS